MQPNAADHFLSVLLTRKRETYMLHGLQHCLITVLSRIAACAPVRFWAVAAAPTPDDPATNVFIDSLCPDVLETLVHTLLLLQVRALGWGRRQA